MQRTEPNWSKDMVDQANKRWVEFWQWAEKSGVPYPLLEALLRDKLAAFDALRLKAFIPVLQLDPELQAKLSMTTEQGRFKP